jgi:3-hydroxyisobutyrate dehydrogenase-like beta-hydroxyacid dehydrogenase
VTVGLLHPGEIGAAIGAALRARGKTVLWTSTGRSPATAERAKEAGLEDVGTIAELGRRSDVILSLCPPHAAVDVARSLTRFAGIYVDANAVSPATARTIAGLVGRYVDGGVIGSPPRKPGTARLYLSGAEATRVAGLFAGTIVDALVVSEDPDAASALKMAYAAWTKGTSALLLAVRAVARTEEVEEALLQEWRTSLPHPNSPSQPPAPRSARVGASEMNEIAETFAAAGLPDGFHRAAAEIYRRSPHEDADGDESLERVLSALGRKV